MVSALSPCKQSLSFSQSLCKYFSLFMTLFSNLFCLFSKIDSVAQRTIIRREFEVFFIYEFHRYTSFKVITTVSLPLLLLFFFCLHFKIFTPIDVNKKINKLSIGFVVRIMERSKIAVFTVFSLIVSRLVYGTHCVYCLCQLELSCTQMRGDITWACNNIQDGHKKSACL